MAFEFGVEVVKGRSEAWVHIHGPIHPTSHLIPSSKLLLPPWLTPPSQFIDELQSALIREHQE